MRAEPKKRMTLGKGATFSLFDSPKNMRATICSSVLTASTAMDSAFSQSHNSGVYLTGFKSTLFDGSFKNSTKGFNSYCSLQRRSSVESLNDREGDIYDEEVRCSHVEGEVNKPAD